MANNSVNINVNVSDNGTVKAVTKKVQALKDLLTQTAGIASSISLGGIATGGGGGGGGGGGTRSSRAASTMAPSGGAASSAATGGTYAQARATMGTGAEARDFAKQSEGLGGLVRLYATYAANIYAAGAAFRALSEAANTANIIQGLNQLGATSGVALGSLSKQFAEVSGGAISLREAMQSTAQATSAGLTSKQFLQLGEVAKKASQALGINMSDAVSRLTRGITKMEPELLDELGIFTKLGKSTEDYAKSVGKTTGSLTDFEKRQAFANAVLKEGSDKFSDINIPTNPYDKLTASLANLSYESLNIVNKGLGPLIDQLSQSPKALLAIVAAIGAIIVKQAIPALSQFRENMVQAAALAESKARSINDTISSLRQMGPPTAAASAHEVVMQRLEDRARKTAAGYSILSNAIDNTRTLGPTNAFRVLRGEIEQNTAGFGKFGQAALAVRGTLSIAATTIGSVVSAFSGLIMGVGAAIAAYQLLSSWLSKNSEDIVKYNDALKYQTEAVTAVTDTTKKYFEVLTIEAVLAQSTAFSNLSDNIVKTADALAKAESNSNWFDKLGNFISQAWSGDLKSKFAESATTAIVEGLKGIKDPEIRKEAEQSFKELLGVSDLTEGLVKEAAKKIDPTIFRRKFEEFGAKDSAASKPLQGLNDGFKEVNKSFQDLSNSLINNDPLSKFGAALVKQASLLDTAFQSPFTTIAALNSILKDTSKIQAFPASTQQVIIDVAKQYEEVYLNIKQYTKQVAEAEALIGKGKALSMGTSQEAKSAGSDLQAKGSADAAQAARLLALAKAQGTELQSRLTAALTAATQKGFELIQGPLSRAIEQAGIDTQKTLLGYLPKTPESVALSAKLEIQAIELKKQELIALHELTDTLKLKTLSDEKQRLLNEQGLAGADRNKFIRIGQQIKDITAQEEAIRNPSAVGKGSRSPGVSAILEQNIGYQTKLTELLSQQNQIRIRAVVDSFSTAIENAVKRSQDSLEDLRKENENFYKSSEFKGLSGEAQLAERARRTKLEEEQANVGISLKAAQPAGQAMIVQARAGAGTDLGRAATAALGISQERQKVTEAQLKAAEAITQESEDDARIQLIITKGLDKQLRDLDKAAALADLKNQKDSQELDALAQKLDFDHSMGKLSEDEYQNQKRINDLRAVELETTSKLASLTTSFNKEQLELRKKMADPSTSGDALDLLVEQQNTSKDLYQSGVEAIKAGANLKTQTINLLASVDQRTKTYADAFNSTVGSMSDALVDFALTGKQSFGDMIQSMIIDLIKFEQRQAMMAAYQAAGGSGGVMGFLGGIASSVGGALFGPSTATAAELANGGGYGAENATYRTNALGGVYDQGRVAFAKGGTFSNTIVTRPTTFAFAKGTGLMGEAGPEAIMPLKRGANGSLGVQGGGGGNVDVVVNNYGSEKASTKESTDARGNRKIEVIIGEMTAAEMNRPNSPVQSSMRNTFGLAPSLTRR